GLRTGRDSGWPGARATVLSSSDPHGVAMGQQAFGFRKNFHGFGEMEESLAGDGWHADAFYKVSGGKSAAPARPAAGRKYVIASRSVIHERLSSPAYEKHRSSGVNARTDGM